MPRGKPKSRQTWTYVNVKTNRTACLSCNGDIGLRSPNCIYSQKHENIYSKQRLYTKAWRLRKLGSSLEKYNEAKYCAICGRDKKLVSDHDHATGKIRGFICQMCNWLVGLRESDPTLFEKVDAYLSLSRTKQDVIDRLSKA